MTIGNRVVDLRSYKPPTYWGAYWIGPYSQKSWNGVDLTPQPNANYFWFKRGSKNLVKKKLWARPPKSARRRPEHPYTCSWERRYNVEVSVKAGPTTWGKAGYHELYGGCSFPSRWGTNDQLKLISRLRVAIGGSSFNAAVSLAEGRQALALIADSARRIYTAWGAVQKKQYSQAANILVGNKQGKHLKARVATNWLELQYGWLPLLNDVYAASEFLAQMFNFPLQETVRVRYSREGGTPLGIPSDVVPLKAFCKLQGQIIARISEVSIPQLLGLTDPLSVIWEKVPYSFVADWFIPIGEWLSARGLQQAVKGTFVVSQMERMGYTGAVSKSGSFRGAEYYSCEIGLMSRTVSSVLPIPLPSFKPLGKAASWRHCLNAVALVAGLAPKQIGSPL